MSSLLLNLVESETKILLESLLEKERAMSEICESSQDEDLIAEVGNDLIELRLLLNSVKEKAVIEFGKSILEFSSELL
jgi:hypothetical protein